MASAERGNGETSTASLMRASSVQPVLAVTAPVEPKLEVEARINQAVRPGGQRLAVRSMELHLIRGLNAIDLGHGPVTVVAFAPEFMYVADVGMPARAGVSVSWVNGPGAGDPTFPDFTTSKLRSIAGGAQSQLIYPAIAGELLIGVDPATPAPDVVAGLEANGLWDVKVTGGLVEGRCDPFREADVCVQLPRSLAFVRYAESNRVVRFVDIQPGWSCTRIA